MCAQIAGAQARANLPALLGERPHTSPAAAPSLQQQQDQGGSQGQDAWLFMQGWPLMRLARQGQVSGSSTDQDGRAW